MTEKNSVQLCSEDSQLLIPGACT